MAYQPAQWLRNLAQISPAPYWPWRQSLRLTLVTTVPMIVGLLTGHILPAMIVCLGGLLTGTSEKNDPYLARFRRILIATPMGMSGYLLGSLIGGHGVATIAGVVVVALLSGLVSGYGAAVSAGALQMLVMTIVAAHVHSTASIWLMPSLFACGAAFAATLLAIEALVSPKRPEREIVANLLNALAHLARTYVQTKPGDAKIEMAIRSVNDAQSKAYAALMHNQLHADGRSVARDWSANILSITDRIAALLNTSTDDTNVLKLAADRLAFLAKTIMYKATPNAMKIDSQSTNPLLYNLSQLSSVIGSPNQSARLFPILHLFSLDRSKPDFSLSRLRARLLLGPEVVNAAIRLAICMLIAMVAEFTAPGYRSYWIPLSVAVILKPDFGSVFVRAVQRSAGTLVGVLVATAILMVMPKDFYLVFVIAILSATIPWAALKGYALQCSLLTPLILILIDLIVAGPTVNYGVQRLTDTVIGAGIVLIFGYLIWPKSIDKSIKSNFSQALITIADYLRSTVTRSATTDETPPKIFDQSAAKRRSAYSELSNLRVQLQRSTSEPPPASTEALAWLPAIATAERICECVTSYALVSESSSKNSDSEIVKKLADILERVANPKDGGAIQWDQIDQLHEHISGGNVEKPIIELYENILKLKDI
ncbi:FUSC family protein [Brucella thiophenivorans]|uniref:Fusaric acid resistance family protein n=1 Tax=Brucella thiophenivorans TaxID=571255 RepID=A0A256FK66_9HYPH|nr:FUSC family protein [Brucella thiophenivorans]OYR15243.1 fusaric acid resistance family protein [Brucella thiophenivorans]